MGLEKNMPRESKRKNEEHESDGRWNIVNDKSTMDIFLLGAFLPGSLS